jgi:hypothetical protein
MVIDVQTLEREIKLSEQIDSLSDIERPAQPKAPSGALLTRTCLAPTQRPQASA